MDILCMFLPSYSSMGLPGNLLNDENHHRSDVKEKRIKNSHRYVTAI